MTTSRLPWSVEAGGSGAYLKDASGKIVAAFFDHRDADLVLAALDEKEQRTIEELKDQIEDLEQEIVYLKRDLAAAEKSA